MAEACPRTLVLESPREGFGHTFLSVLFGLTAARNIGLSVDDIYLGSTGKGSPFWATVHEGGQFVRGLRPHYQLEEYTWASKVVPLPLYNETQQLPDGVVVQRFRSWEDLGHGWRCHSHMRVNLGSPVACNNKYCFSSMPGAIDRGVELLHRSRLASIPTFVPAPRSARGEPVRVVWNFRTYDHGENEAAGKETYKGFWKNENGSTAIKVLLDRGLRTRGLQHTVVAQALVPWLQETQPWLIQQPSFSSEQDFKTMRDAEVLVSTGSSFSLAAACVAPIGQLHLSMPGPRLMTEVFRVGDLRDYPHQKLRQDPHYQTMFIRRNTVPLTEGGEVVPEYRQKLELMLSAIDRGRRPSQAVSEMSFETYV